MQIFENEREEVYCRGGQKYRGERVDIDGSSELTCELYCYWKVLEQQC